ncbi:MAG: Rne/Rng family ribonuclease [Victivallales bacterium]|nr:Rne/Rng family ribonuclease [Victivallales bacterium]
MKRILINREELQTRIAIVDEGRLEDFFIERTDRNRLAGSIFKARIRNLEPSLQAAFVDIGAKKNAFLHYWDMLPATWDMIEEELEPPETKRKRHRRAPKPKPEEVREQRVEPVPEAPVKRGLLGRLKARLLPKPAVVEPAPEPVAKKPEPRPPRTRRHRKKANPYTVEDIPELFQVNTDVLVQVNKGPIGNKGARVTTNLSIPGRYLVLLPRSSHVGVSKRVEDRDEKKRLRQILQRLELPAGMGLICRTVGEGIEEAQFRDDLDMLLGIWKDMCQTEKTTKAPCCVYREPGLAERVLRDSLSADVDEIITDSEEMRQLAIEQVSQFGDQGKLRVNLHTRRRQLFNQYEIVNQIESIFRRRVSLPGGGYLCFDETEALIAIDVNTGRNRSGEDHSETILVTNLEAVDEVARQLRMRNIGGLVVVDFIDMRSRKDQQTVYTAFRQAMSKDRARTKICPISPLGLVEMTRQREEASVRSQLYMACPYCAGRGLVKSAVSMSVEIQRRLQGLMQRRRSPDQIRVHVHPSILERLRDEDARLLSDMETALGGELSFRGDAALHIEEFRLIDQRTGAEL